MGSGQIRPKSLQRRQFRCKNLSRTLRHCEIITPRFAQFPGAVCIPQTTTQITLKEVIMRILVAGATGAIGRLLLPLLVEAGHEVTGTTRSPDKQPMIADLSGHPVVLDALDRQAVFAVMQTAQPDVL